jgi:uncharacterized membrane protein
MRLRKQLGTVLFTTVVGVFLFSPLPVGLVVGAVAGIIVVKWADGWRFCHSFGGC